MNSSSSSDAMGFSGGTSFILVYFHYWIRGDIHLGPNGPSRSPDVQSPSLFRNVPCRSGGATTSQLFARSTVRPEAFRNVPATIPAVPTPSSPEVQITRQPEDRE